MGKFYSLFLSLGLFATACSPARKTEADSSIKIVDEMLTQEDLLKPGAFTHTEHEYSTGAYFDPDIVTFSSPDIYKSDIRGRLFLPDGQGPFPLVMLLHGNHATCGVLTGQGNPRIDNSVAFTNAGSCPAGSIEAPSYRGYDAAARLLASYGFAVASINANRGITGQSKYNVEDSSYVLARGNLVLRHLEELSKWSREGETNFLTVDNVDLKDKLDFSKVGLMGHSRGGEGVRFAYNLYTSEPSASKWKDRIPGLEFQGIFEIGPVDVGINNGKNKIEAEGVAWNVLIPGCDNDVSDFSGVNPYERMLTNMKDGYPKSVFTLWGANHNFFNSEWQVSDAPHTCVGNQKPLWNVNAEPMPYPYINYDANARRGLIGSETQIKFEKALMVSFFRAHLGTDEEQKYGHIFDPQYRLPAALSSLAASSREYSLAADSKAVFKPEQAVDLASIEGNLTIRTLRDHIDKTIESLTAGLHKYAADFNLGDYSAELSKGSFIRPAVAIEGKGNTAGQTVVLPLAKIESGAGFWTLDMGMANRKGCNKFVTGIVLSCPDVPVDDSFEVALVLEDGTVTRAVHIKDYVNLDNWYSDYFQKQGIYFGAGDSRVIRFRYVPILYQTARFELTDFNVTDQKIKAVQLTFTSGEDVSLIVDSMRLSKHP